MKDTLQFLKDLKKNNNRDWFNDNKPRYQASKDEFTNFMQEVATHMNEFDQIDPKFPKVFRIFRDVRFGKDKTPYKTSWGASMQRDGADKRGGYYVNISPGDNFIGGGFWGPESADLLHIRKQIAQDPESFKKAIEYPDITNYFEGLGGEKVKTAPKGFDKEDPAIEYLKFKHFLLHHNFSDKDVVSKNFAKSVAEGLAKMRPFFDYMSDILSTDLNGLPLV